MEPFLQFLAGYFLGCVMMGLCAWIIVGWAVPRTPAAPPRPVEWWNDSPTIDTPEDAQNYLAQRRWRP